jgi:hypothetical protein
MDALAVAEAQEPESNGTANAGIQDSAPEPENKFQRAIAAWRGKNGV